MRGLGSRMHRAGWRAWAAALVAGTAVAGPIETRRVPEQAAWVAHLDVALLRQGDVGAFLLEQVTRPPLSNRLAALRALLQFDLREDLRGLTLIGFADRPEAGAMVLDGRFDADHLTTVVRGARDYSETVYHGDTVHHWMQTRERGEAHPMFAAFDGPDRLLLASDETALQTLLDVARDRRPSLANRPETFLPRTEAPAALVAGAADVGSAVPEGPRSAMLRGSRRGSIVLAESVGRVTLQVSLMTADAERARRLADVVRGIAALVELEADTPPVLAQAARNLQVQADGSVLNARTAAPAQRLVEALRARLEEAAPENASP